MPVQRLRFHPEYNFEGAVRRALTRGTELDSTEVPAKVLKKIGDWTDTTQSYRAAPIGKDKVFVHVDDMLAGKNMDEGFIAADLTGHVVASGSFNQDGHGNILADTIKFDALPGAATAETVAGLPAQRLEATAEVKKLTDKLLKASGGNMVSAGTFQFAPKDLGKKLAGSGAKAFVFDAVRAVAKEDWTTPWAETPRAAKSVKELRKTDVPSALWDALQMPSTVDKQGNETADSKKATKAAKEDAAKLVRSLLSEKSDKVYLTNWNNQDDTNVFGVVAVNTKSGHMSIVKMVPAI